MSTHDDQPRCDVCGERLNYSGTGHVCDPHLRVPASEQDDAGAKLADMLQRIRKTLVEEAEQLPHEARKILYENLWDLYEDGPGDDAGAEAASPPMHLTTQCTTCGATGVVGGEKCQVCQGSGVNPYAPPPCPVCGIAYGSCDCAPKRIREITARLRAKNERLRSQLIYAQQKRPIALLEENAALGRRLAELENSEQRLALACHRLLSDFRAALGRRPIRAADETIVEAEVALEKRARKLLEEK